MRILLVGSFKYEVYDAACANAFKRLNHDVYCFPWQKYYGSGYLQKFQQKYLLGPGIVKINRDLILKILTIKPDVVFVTRGVPLWSSTIIEIKKKVNTFLISNNNDDPFGNEKGQPLWRHFIKSIPYYDLHFVFRSANISEYEAVGAKKVRLLLPYYVPELHLFPNKHEIKNESYLTDVVFVGQAREDDRLFFLKALSEKGFNYHIYGIRWELLAKEYPWLKGHYHPAVWGGDYTSAIRNAKVALVFFSKGNRDTYTTRSFEIPAIGSCMLSERTSEMMGFFQENLEAVYFSTPQELVTKVDWLLYDNSARCLIEKNAKKRLQELKASVDDRMQQVIETINELKV